MAGSALVVGLQDGLEDDQDFIFDVLAFSRTPLLDNKLRRM
jgi:hypothetical protein